MKAEELRIGNWINLYDDYNSQITGFTNTGKVWFVNNPHDEKCAWIIENIKPIPLTEKWLLNSGFIERPDCYSLQIGNDIYFISIKGVLYIFGPDCPNEGYGIEVNVKYIHQLQNLYYTLTGRELEIK